VVVLVVTVLLKTVTVESMLLGLKAVLEVEVVVVVMVTALQQPQVLVVLQTMVLVVVAVRGIHTAVKVVVEQEEVVMWQFVTQTVMEPLYQLVVDLDIPHQLTGLTECTNLQVVQEL
jgi:hypothetical protein